MNLLKFILVLILLALPLFQASAQVVNQDLNIRSTNVVVIPKWQLALDSEAHTPQTADLDRDGKAEIIISTYKYIYIASYSGKIVSKIPIVSSENENPPVIVNMDSDKDLEIVSDDGKNVGAWNMDGTVVSGWPQKVDRDYVNAVMASDLEKDGKMDIIASAYDASGISQIYIWNSNGQKRAGWPKNFNYYSGTPALSDLNKDGKIEIVFPTRKLGNQAASSKLFVFKENGTLLPGWPITHPRDINVVSVGDLDGNGSLEILAGTGYALDFGGNKIRAFNKDGTPFGNWSNPLTNYNLTHISIGDINNNGKLEIAVDDAAGGGGFAKLLSYNGEILNGWPITISQIEDALQAPILVDITNDGKADFISPLGSGKIFAAERNGTRIPLDINIAPFFATHVLVNDFDRNGKLEMLVVGIDFNTNKSKMFMYSLSSNTNSSTFLWKSERHDLKNTGKYTKVPQTNSLTPSALFNDIEE